MSYQEMDDRLEIRAPDVLASPGSTDISSLPEQLRSENDRIKFFFLKNLKSHGKFYPSAEKLFTKKLKEETLSTTNFIRTVTNLTMIETGFVPLTPKKIPVCSVKELLSLSLESRMVKLTETLMLYLEKPKSKLNVVYYTYIKAKDKHVEKKLLSPATSRIEEATPVQDIDKFEFSSEAYKLLIWYSGEQTLIALKGTNCDLNLEVDRSLFWSTTLKKKEKLPLQDLISNFVVQQFLSQMKQKICYVFLDKFGALGAEYQGFQQLPDEVIEQMARYFDVRSMIKFSMTCHRINRLLDTNANWKIQLKRIPADFLQYRYTVPSQDTLRSRLMEEGPFKEKYKGIYTQAKSDLRDIEQQRFWINAYNWRFAFLRHGFGRP